MLGAVLGAIPAFAFSGLYFSATAERTGFHCPDDFRHEESIYYNGSITDYYEGTDLPSSLFMSSNSTGFVLRVTSDRVHVDNKSDILPWSEFRFNAREDITVECQDGEIQVSSYMYEEPFGKEKR